MCIFPHQLPANWRCILCGAHWNYKLQNYKLRIRNFKFAKRSGKLNAQTCVIKYNYSSLPNWLTVSHTYHICVYVYGIYSLYIGRKSIDLANGRTFQVSCCGKEYLRFFATLGGGEQHFLLSFFRSFSFFFLSFSFIFFFSFFFTVLPTCWLLPLPLLLPQLQLLLLLLLLVAAVGCCYRAFCCCLVLLLLLLPLPNAFTF